MRACVSHYASFTILGPDEKISVSSGRGGQSALRFARLRMEKRHNYVRKVAETAVSLFISNDKVRSHVRCCNCLQLLIHQLPTLYLMKFCHQTFVSYEAVNQDTIFVLCYVCDLIQKTHIFTSKLAAHGTPTELRSQHVPNLLKKHN